MSKEKIFIARPSEIQSLQVKRGLFTSKLVVNFLGGATATMRGSRDDMVDMFLRLQQALDAATQQAMQASQQQMQQQMQMQAQQNVPQNEASI